MNDIYNLLDGEKFANLANERESKNESKKHSIYKSAVFSGATEKREKSKLRGALRAKLQNFVSMFFACKNIESKIEVIEKFAKHYNETYVINDYSVNSVSTSEETKKDKFLIAFMDMCKAYNDTKNETK